MACATLLCVSLCSRWLFHSLTHWSAPAIGRKRWENVNKGQINSYYCYPIVKINPIKIILPYINIIRIQLPPSPLSLALAPWAWNILFTEMSLVRNEMELCSGRSGMESTGKHSNLKWILFLSPSLVSCHFVCAKYSLSGTICYA